MGQIITAALVNWKTTLFGCLLAAGNAAAAYLSGQTGIWPYVGSVLIAIISIVAKDGTVTGAPPPPAP